jgi:Rhodanese-like domain
LTKSKRGFTQWCLRKPECAATFEAVFNHSSYFSMKSMFFSSLGLAVLSCSFFNYAQRDHEPVSTSITASSVDSLPIPSKVLMTPAASLQFGRTKAQKPVMMQKNGGVGYQEPEEYPQSMVDFDAYLQLSNKVYEYRKDRLIDYATFLEMAKDSNTIILDTRSDSMYAQEHLKGAIHLNFSDFNIRSLARVIPSHQTRILIYCNNNFSSGNPAFASKIALPTDQRTVPLYLALNIPTFTNLYGYGYKNVYELSSLLDSYDPQVQMEGNSKRLRMVLGNR